MREKTIQFKNCVQCPDSGYSGAFTPGGAWMICEHNDVCYRRPGIKPEDWMARRLPVHPGTRDYDGTFPGFCPYQDVDEQVADPLPAKAHFVVIITLGGLVDSVYSRDSRREAVEWLKTSYIFHGSEDDDFDAWIYKVYPGKELPNTEFVTNARQVLNLD